MAMAGAKRPDIVTMNAAMIAQAAGKEASREIGEGEHDADGQNRERGEQVEAIEAVAEAANKRRADKRSDTADGVSDRDFGFGEARSWNEDGARNGMIQPPAITRAQLSANARQMNPVGNDFAHLPDGMWLWTAGAEVGQGKGGDDEVEHGTGREEKEWGMPAIVSGKKQTCGHTEHRGHGKGSHDQAHRSAAAARRDDITDHGGDQGAGNVRRKHRRRRGRR